MKKKGIVLFLLSALLFTACGTEKNKTEETDKLTVVTSFYPVYLLAQEMESDWKTWHSRRRAVCMIMNYPFRI